MSDPTGFTDVLSIAANVVGLISSGAHAGHRLFKLGEKYAHAKNTIAAICASSSLISVSLTQLQDLLASDPDNIGDHLRRKPDLHATFDNALAGCKLVYSCLEDEIQRLSVDAENADNATWKDKKRIVWKEEEMKEILESLRSQQQALTLLIQVVQVESLNDIKRILQEQHNVVERAARRAGSLRASHPAVSVRVPESIFTSDRSILAADESGKEQEFAFDEALLKSPIYQKTLAAARQGKARESRLREAQSAQPPEIPEERPPLPPRRSAPNAILSPSIASASDARRRSYSTVPVSSDSSTTPQSPHTLAQSSTDMTVASVTTDQTTVPAMSPNLSEDHSCLNVYEHWPSATGVAAAVESEKESPIAELAGDLARSFDLASLTDPEASDQDIRSPDMATADDVHVREIWDEILHSESLYVDNLRRLRSSFRDPILAKWQALAPHLQALDMLDEMIKLNEDQLLSPLREQLASGALTCASPIIFQTWWNQAGPTYRKYYMRYPHMAAAIQTTLEVDSKFTKFVKAFDKSANKALQITLIDLLVAPMRQIDYYCESLHNATSRSFSSETMGFQAKDFMKTCQILKQFKASSTAVLETAAAREEIHSLRRRISSLNASFSDVLDMSNECRKILYQGPLSRSVKGVTGRVSWSDIYCVLLDNYLFFGQVEPGRRKSGEKLWIFDAPLSTAQLKCGLEAQQEQPIKPSLLNGVRDGQEVYPFTVSTITTKQGLGAGTRQLRHEWMDAILSAITRS